MINCTGKLIYLHACLRECNCAGLIDKPDVGKNFFNWLKFIVLSKYTNTAVKFAFTETKLNLQTFYQANNISKKKKKRLQKFLNDLEKLLYFMVALGTYFFPWIGLVYIH